VNNLAEMSDYSLDNVIQDGIQDGIEEEGFIIDDPQKAEWAMLKIAEMERAAKAYIDVCKAQIKRYTELAAKKEKELEEQTAYLKHKLALYMRSKNAPIRKNKDSDSLVLPSGIVRRVKERYKMVPDEDKLLELYDDTSYVEYTPKLLWGELKKNFEIVYDDAGNPEVVDIKTGEVVDGVDLEYVPEKVVVKVNE